MCNEISGPCEHKPHSDLRQVRVESTQDPHYLYCFPSHLLILFTSQYPSQNTEKIWEVLERFDDVGSVATHASERANGCIAPRCRRLVLEGVYNNVHDILNMGRQVLPTDARKAADARENARRNRYVGILRFRKENFKNGYDVWSNKPLDFGHDEIKEKCAFLAGSALWM